MVIMHVPRTAFISHLVCLDAAFRSLWTDTLEKGHVSQLLHMLGLI